MKTENDRTSGLKPVFTPLGIWSISIGTSIGWGSFIVTCNTYLLKSGILGTVLGLLIGMAVILVITWNLQYMIRSAPDAGGTIHSGSGSAERIWAFLPSGFCY